MVKRINSLTDEQKAKMPEWRDRWIAKGLRTGEADWDRFERGIRVAYAKAGFPFPETIVRVRSPLLGAFASSIADSVLQGNAVRTAAVSDAVYDAVGVNVAVRVAVVAAVGNAVNVAVPVTVRNAVGRAVGDVVRNVVRNAVSAAVGDVVGGVVGDAVRDAAHNPVRDAVRAAVQPNLKWHEWIGGQFWVGGWWGSPAFVSFFTDVCGLELPTDIQERANAYRDICESVNYVWCNSKFVMVCEHPTAIRRDQQGRLSSDQKMAIEYPDGWGLYALDGVVLSKELWQRIVSKAMTFEEIMRIENADHQAVALVYNPEAIIANGATLIDGPTAKGNELFVLENSDLNGLTGYPQMYYVRMKCSTGRTFIEDVEPEFAGANPSADACQAFNGSLTPEMYRMLRREA